MSHTSPRQGGVRYWRHVGAVLLASGLGLWVHQGAHAAAPPAGTSITNQATLSYKDNTGTQQLASSNTVITLVAQVGAYTLTPTPGNTKSAAAGATVYMPYVLTNTGNGTDTFAIDASEAAGGGAEFTKIEVFLDAGNGLPASTTPLCTQTTAGSLCSISKELAANESFKFVVAYGVPATATPSTWNAVAGGGNTGLVKVKPAAGSTWISTYSQSASDKSESRTDTVKLTTGAAFSVSKAIMAPAVSPVSGSWPVKNSGQRGVQTTYTLRYTNNGALASNLYIKDVLPAGFTYVTGQSVISCAPGTALTEAASGDGGLCGNVGHEFEQSGQTVQAVIASVQPGESGTLSFQVQVANSAPMGTGATSNTAQYTADGCASSIISVCSSSTLVNTNTSEFTVLATRGVRFNVQDTTPGTPASVSDGVTSAFIVPGGFVKQIHTIQNNGNAPDTFNLTEEYSLGTGYVFRWFQTDGITPLLDTDGNGQIDTGVMQANETKTFVLQITAPNSASVGSSVSAKLTATSGNSLNEFLSPAARDATYADITTVRGGYVDLTNSASGTATAGDIGPGPGITPVFTTAPIVAGAVANVYAEIPLFVKNNDSAATTYSLDASGSNNFPGSLPAGWAVKYVLATDSCFVFNAITTVNVPANGGQTAIKACVSMPSTAPTSTQPIYFRVAGTATNGSTVSDVIYDAVSVLAKNAYRMELVAPTSASAIRGGMVDLPHTLTNTGTRACGVNNNLQLYTIMFDAAKVAAGWTTAYYLDGNGNGVIDAGDTLITDGILRPGAGGLLPGANLKFLVRIYVPGGANIGDLVKVMVNVGDMAPGQSIAAGDDALTTPNGCGGVYVEDQVTVVTSTLSVLKKQAKATPVSGSCPAIPDSGSMSAANQVAAPGDCVYYEVTAINTGPTPVGDISISDAAPSYTTLKTTPVIQCTATSVIEGTLGAATTSGNNVTCGGGIKLAPGGTLTLRFATQINN